VPVRITFGLTVQVSDVFGATRNVTGNWQLFAPIILNCPEGSQCISCPTTGNGGCADNTILYGFGSPDDNVQVVVDQVCNVNGPTCTPGTTDLPPNWSATADAGTVSISMNCNNLCADGQGGFGNNFYGDIYVHLVDNGRCVAASHKTSIQTVINIDI
jgi:hypothetical protein